MSVSPAAIAAAWNAWHARHGGKLGPGPAFVEAIEAALAVEMPAACAEARREALRDALLACAHKAWDDTLAREAKAECEADIRALLGDEEKEK